MREDRVRLYDILEAIERIEKYTGRGRSVFDEDELIQTLVLHHLQLIGEAVRALSVNTTSSSEDIDWGKIVGMRNILVHNYFSIDTDIVWAVIENDLETLKSKIQKFLDKNPKQILLGRCFQEPMKRCPECRRDYYDDTLLYCLDDGNALLDDPGFVRQLKRLGLPE